MSYNGSGTFNINTSGQPVTTGTTIDATVFNALTTDLATGLSTAICKDGQTTVTANIPMAGYKLTGVGTGTATTDAATVQNVNLRSMCEGRLTLETGVPISTTDQTAKETLYFTPYKGNCIALYDGTNWVRRTFSEVSVDVPDATGVYDVFAYDNSGTVTLEVLAWTNTTTRATALTTQDGVLVKTGALTRRYLGSFYSTTAGNGQIEDSVANRYLWNYYNRVPRIMRVLESTNTWQYTTATIRQANNSTANQLNFVIGYSEDLVEATICAAVYNSSPIGVAVGVGLDTTSAFTTGGMFPLTWTSAASSIPDQLHASLKCFPGVGKHYLSWNEYSGASGTTTWVGDNGDASIYQSGIHGVLWG